MVIASAVFVRKPGDPRRRNYFMEAFTIDEGKIVHVHAAIFYVDPAVPLPNWPTLRRQFSTGAGVDGGEGSGGA